MQLKPFTRYDRKTGGITTFYRLIFDDQHVYNNFIDRCAKELGTPEPANKPVVIRSELYKWIIRPDNLSVCIKKHNDFLRLVPEAKALILKRLDIETKEEIGLWIARTFPNGGCVFDAFHNRFTCLDSNVYLICSLAWE